MEGMLEGTQVGGPLDLEAALEDGVRKNRRLVIIRFFHSFFALHNMSPLLRASTSTKNSPHCKPREMLAAVHHRYKFT